MNFKSGRRKKIFILPCILSVILFLCLGCELWHQIVKNNPPVSDAGQNLTVTVGNMVILDGRYSYDPDGDKINFTWFPWDTPAGSMMQFYNYLNSMPYFTPDQAGDYVFILIVDDGYIEGKPNSVTITANP